MRFSVHIIGMGIGLALFQGVVVAEERPELTSDADRISYSLGHQVGRDLKQQNMEPDSAIIQRGIEDGLAGKPPLLPEKEMQTSLKALKQDIVSAEQEERMNAIQERRIKREMARKEGQAFLAANTKKTGVTTLSSGLQYKIIKSGKGRKPVLTDTVTVHYRGTLLDGNEFGSTRGGEPESFPVNDLIPGLEEALLLMQPGARWELYIPPELGFGRRGPLEDQTLVYDLELLRIEQTGKETAADKGS
jgi:FKBP-type peptidyl-prolyl cis-trans isomerase FklB